LDVPRARPLPPRRRATVGLYELRGAAVAIHWGATPCCMPPRRAPRLRSRCAGHVPTWRHRPTARTLRWGAC